MVNRDTMKHVVCMNGVKDGAKNVGGSRFTILSEEVEEDSGGQVNATPSIVLIEISNRKASRKTQLSCPTHSMYLIDNSYDKSNFNKPFKENVCKKGVKGSSKLKIKGGANMKGFDIIISDMRRIFHFEVVSILEHRISGSRACKIVGKLGFTDKFIVDASGFSLGIWLLGNNMNVEFQVVASSRHTITMVAAAGAKAWVLTISFANPSAIVRRCL
ncbi:hypothetical protein Ddye_008715 [Dipteronia dyeriana]|uniref:Uncharacterized protein n=1 Tax=Dipteronia dyeriana TaxID=168575 RepID=A0AAE0CM65_9ROSI|nr:hypothetical protein Ddye_008715 [Dipteronia dyeriana]